MEFFNSLNLTQIKGGTKLKQGDLGSVLSYSLTDENGQEITSFDNKTAYINLVLDDKIWFTTTTLVDISRVTFRIDKAIPIGLYYLEIKIDDYIFPSDRDSIILIEEGSTPYDLKELVPNYDINMTLKGILSDLSQKGIDIRDLNRRADELINETTAQLQQKVGGGVLATMGDLSQDVKTAMSGGSVAVVGDGAVAFNNLANDLSVALGDKTYLGTVETGKLGASDGTSINNASTYLLTVDVTGLDKVYINGASNSANYFIIVFDDKNNILHRPNKDSSNKTYTNLPVTLPAGATKLFINSRIDAPQPTCHRFVLQPVASKLQTLEQNMNLYKNINYGVHDDLVEWLGAFGGTFDNNVSTVTAVNQGVRTNNFTANSPATKIKLDCDFTVDFVSVQIGINKSDGSVNYKAISIDNTGGTLVDSFEFDSANLVVYGGAVSFFVIVNSTTSSKPGTITINELSVNEPSSVELHDMYDDDFLTMVEKIFVNIEQNKSDINSIPISAKPVLTGPGGEKYDLQIGASGNLVAVPHIPTKTLFMGNSLLLGMDTSGAKGGAFGMAATSPSNDYFYRVSQAIRAKKPTATFTKLHVAAFEQAESNEAAESYISENSAAWTSDLDLVIIQIGDNVNSPIRQTTFNTNFPKLLQQIRTNSPNARIICVSGWFNYNSIADDVQRIANEKGCDYIFIKPLYVAENMGVAGATVTYADNSTGVIDPAWVSHPGNVGMQAIANVILDKMDM